jgi:signal transduction histidine kinase
MPPILPEIGQTSLLPLLAHELRAPLSGLVAGSELLVDQLEALDPAQLRDTASIIHRGTRWMQELMENLLCASSLSAGRFQLQRRLARPADLVAEVEPVIAPMVSKKQQVLRVVSRGTIPDVWADRRRIGQVLVNLISNASKYSPSGEVLYLTLTARQQRVRITIADRGPGLPPGSPLRLFEPFYRAAPAVTSGTEGLGLGLAIVKAIVDSHGGRVGASRRRGGGARFWFELPAKVAKPASGGATTRRRKGA